MTLSPGLLRARITSTTPTPTSVVMRICLASGVQPQWRSAKPTNAAGTSGIGPR